MNIDGEHELKSKKEYINKWKNDSINFFENGYYEWMHSFIKEKDSVLEIGCGAGHTTLILAREHKKIVSLDDNIECLLATKELMEENGYKVKLIRKYTIVEQIKQGIVSSKKIRSGCEEDSIYLIESDVIKDDELFEWLKPMKFDCVIVWLMGTVASKYCLNDQHIYTALKNESKHFNEWTYTYKNYLVNSIMKKWDQIIEEDGILHTVDKMKKTDNLNKVPDSYDKEAEDNGLKICCYETKQYTHIENGIHMGYSDGGMIEKEGLLMSIKYKRK